jgi:hypothetical protein
MGPFISTLVLIAVCGVIGVRLLALARRTRGLPELLIGAAFVLAGGFGIGFSLLRAIAPVPDGVRLALAGVSSVGMHAGVSCIAAFTWRVFRPGDVAGKLGFVALATLLLASLVRELATQEPTRVAAGMQALWSVTVCATVYLWAAFESGRYWILLRRRLRIGIGDRFVATQMLCWSIGSLAIALGWIRDIVLKLSGVSTDAIGSYATTFLVLVCAGAYWIAFFPPARFRRWVAAAG